MSNRQLSPGTKMALAIVTITGALAGCASPQLAGQEPARHPMSAQTVPQPTDQASLKMIASNLNAQRSEYYRKRDLAALTSLYTPDASYIQLAPRYDLMKGRDQIRKHMQELIDANASEFVYTVTTAEQTGDDTVRVGGDYYVTVQGGQKAFGHFTQVLRRDGDTWKIAVHTFARPEPITASEISACGLGCRTGFFGYR
jgi:uncharacterized protein (TIGR02246 family)